MKKISMKTKLFTVWVFFLTNFKRLFRDKTALFFTFLFPLIFLFVFGGISGKSGTSFNVAIISDSNSTYYQKFDAQAKKDKVLKISDDVTTMDQAKEKMSRGQLDSTIYFPSDFGTNDSGKAQIIYTQNTAQSGQAVQAYVQTAYFTPL